MANVPHQSLERYELLDRIAVGGMAEVFRAKAYGAHGFEKTLAIKRILPDLARNPEFVERFIREAKLAVQLAHANIVQVFDFGRTDGTLFIAMEFIDGLDLAGLLKYYRSRGEQVPAPAAFHIAVDLARGLGFAHQHGVVHRDVSPSNILLSRAGEVKIADFGIAVASDQAPGVGSSRRIMGKWRYMSPEQTVGESLSTHSDLFSAAVVLFELFTGEKLFPGQESDEISENIRSMPIPPLASRRDGMPSELDQVLSRALERDPRRRPTAEEMLRGLIEVSYQSSIVATALDVGDVVSRALESLETERARARADVAARSGGQGGFDELIRAQLLGGGAPTQRRTAVDDTGGKEQAPAGQDDVDIDLSSNTSTAGTLFRRSADEDGVTILEADPPPFAGDSGEREDVSEGAVGEGAVGEGTAGDADDGERGAGGQGAQLSEKLIELAERVPARAAEQEGAEEMAPGVDGGGRGRIALAIGAFLLASAAGLGIYALGNSKLDEPRTPEARVTAAPEPAMAILELSSEPRGATVALNGVALAEKAPVTVKVEPDRPHTVELSLRGHRPQVDEVVARAGERVRLRAVLVPVRGLLRVDSEPAGADVFLGDEKIGQTPLYRDDMVPGERQRLTIKKETFREVEVEVDIEEGAVARVSERLRPEVEYGRINLHIVDSWAEVSLDGRSLGQAPGTLRLPVGTHRLRLYNPTTRKRGSIKVRVFADRVRTYTATL